MTLDELIADVEKRLERHRLEATAAFARLRATEAELDALRAAASTGRAQPGMTRTEAIIALLHKADGPVQTHDITADLNDAGIESTAKDVSSTLHHLLAQRRILRHARGSYRIA